MEHSADPTPLSELLDGNAAVFTMGLLRVPNLQAFLGARRILFRPLSRRGVDYVVGWGHRKTTGPARAFAERHGLPFVRLEDGFLRSNTPGRSQPTASLVIDPEGIYYDPRTPSRLEKLITESGHDSSLIDRAERLIVALRSHRLSKYNDGPDDADLVRHLPAKFVLVVDQLAGDASVAFGAGGAASFETMLTAARRENPGVTIVVKSHPAASFRRRGAFAARSAVEEDVVWFDRRVNPHLMLERATKVYVASSMLGFEALLHGKVVCCFGAPFYAGWGLTDDRVPALRRGLQRSLAQLTAAAYLEYSRYVHPVTGCRSTVEEIVEHFALQKRYQERNRGAIFCFGLRAWKRRHIRRFLASPTSDVHFCADVADAEGAGFGPSSRAIVWGVTEPAAVRDLAARHAVPLERMEDGFIRSVELGSDLSHPRSLVVDRQGIYYDPSAVSDLEQLLAGHEFSASDLQRASALRQRLVRDGLSKYNMPAREHTTPGRVGASKIVLVVGQVETDASIRLGAVEVRTNLELLRRTHAECTGRTIVYKPHPDVEAGNRPGAVPDEQALRYCNRVEREQTIPELLAGASDVFTITSLVGFEGLLRGLRVVVFGMPFYAGWGLTEDRAVCARRSKRLSIDALVAGAFILYPRYLDPTTGYFCTVEQTIDALQAERARPTLPARFVRLPLGRHLLRAYRFLSAEALERLHV